METASLRIKFTPLIKDYRKNDSKCCLEIVPEVTRVQNLDRIEWRQKSDFIEYTVPMTYKVILRKRQEDIGHDLDKVYHSCVDLLPTSSSMCISFGCGDTDMKMISDTLIYENYRSTPDTNMTLPTSNTEFKPLTVSNEIKNELIDASAVILDQFLDELSNENISINECAVTKIDASTSQLLIKDHKKADTDSSFKIASTSCSKIALHKQSKTDLDETEPSTGSNNEKSQNSLRKLSVTPIYSIDTIENEVDQNFPSISQYSAMNSFFKPQKIITETIKIPEVLHSSTNDKIISKKVLDSAEYCSIQNNFCVFERELPEIRVANFMKKMETEIMPLKIMLHDILQKCTTMGLIMNKSYLLKEHPITNTQLIQFCTSEKQTRCNRVVYSIIFDG